MQRATTRLFGGHLRGLLLHHGHTTAAAAAAPLLPLSSSSFSSLLCLAARGFASAAKREALPLPQTSTLVGGLQYAPELAVGGPASPGLPQTSARKTTTYAVRYNIASSQKKLREACKLVQRLSVNEAMIQCQFSVRKSSKIMQALINSAAKNAVNNFGMDLDRLLVDQCWVGKGQDLKRIKYHARGKTGRMIRRRTHMWVVVKEVPRVEGEKRLGRFGRTHATQRRHDEFRSQRESAPAPAL